MRTVILVSNTIIMIVVIVLFAAVVCFSCFRIIIFVCTLYVGVYGTDHNSSVKQFLNFENISLFIYIFIYKDGLLFFLFFAPSLTLSFSHFVYDSIGSPSL